MSFLVSHLLQNLEVEVLEKNFGREMSGNDNRHFDKLINLNVH